MTQFCQYHFYVTYIRPHQFCISEIQSLVCKSILKLYMFENGVVGVSLICYFSFAPMKKHMRVLHAQIDVIFLWRYCCLCKYHIMMVQKQCSYALLLCQVQKLIYNQFPNGKYILIIYLIFLWSPTAIGDFDCSVGSFVCRNGEYPRFPSTV